MDTEYQNLFVQTRDALASGNQTLEATNIIQNVLDIFTAEIRECATLALAIIIIGILSGIVGTIQNNSDGSAVPQASFFACFAMMSAAAAECFLTALDYGTQIINSMSTFVTTFCPILTTMLLSSGQSVSAAAFHPVLTSAVYVITICTQKVILPLIKVGAVLAIVNNLSGRVQVSGFNSLVGSVTKWILTVVLTIFTGITAVYGFTTPVLDKISAKTMKFAVGSLVPVVGGLLSDTIETVAGSTQLMKNAVGTAGVVTICVMCAVPIIKIAVIVLVLRLAHAFTEPLTDGRISGMIKDMCSAVSTVLAVVITAAVLFVINIGIILAATGI